MSLKDKGAWGCWTVSQKLLDRGFGTDVAPSIHLEKDQVGAVSINIQVAWAGLGACAGWFILSWAGCRNLNGLVNFLRPVDNLCAQPSCAANAFRKEIALAIQHHYHLDVFFWNYGGRPAWVWQSYYLVYMASNVTVSGSTNNSKLMYTFPPFPRQRRNLLLMNTFFISQYVEYPIDKG
jgi:hypothetical protein